MQTIDVRGFIVPDEDAFFYRFFGFAVTCPRDILRALERANGEEVTVRINSYGGDVWSGSEIYTALKSYAGQVNIEVTGLAASAASVIMMAGDEVRASPTCEIMIHNPSSRAEGDYRVMRHAAKSLRNTREAIVNAYELRTGIDRARIRSMMDEETWMTAQKAVETGFADEIMFTEGNAMEIESIEDENTASEGAAARAAAISMPSARDLRTKYAVWQEIAPGANSIDEARAFAAQKSAEAQGKHPENEPNTTTAPEGATKRASSEIELIRAKIKTIAM